MLEDALGRSVDLRAGVDTHEECRTPMDHLDTHIDEEVGRRAIVDQGSHVVGCPPIEVYTRDDLLAIVRSITDA